MESEGQGPVSGGGDPNGDRLESNRHNAVEPPRGLPSLGIKTVIGGAVLLSILSLIAIAAAAPSALIPVVPGLGAALLIYFAAIAALCFSPRLAALATIWLSLCFLWAFGILVTIGIEFVAETIAAIFAVNAVNALIIAHLVYGVTVELSRDMLVEAAIRNGLRRWAMPGAVAAAVILISVLVLAPLEPLWISTLFVTSASAFFVSAPVIYLGLPLSLGQTSSSESSVARANRQRERREDILGRLALLAAPRWAYSIFGIFVVVVVVVISEGGRASDFSSTTTALLWRACGPALGLSIIAAGFIGAVTARDWRAGLVCMLAPFLFASWGAALSYHFQLASLASSAKILVIGGGFGAGLCILLVDAISVYRRFDDDLQTAFARSVNESGPVLTITGVAIALAAAVFALRFGELYSVSLVILFEVLGVIVVVPALMSAIDDLVPKRKSAAELYGRGRSR